VKALVTGAAGRLGRELARTVPPGARALLLTRAELDVTDAASVAEAFRAHRPDVVINSAAYTNVERAEDEPAAAHATNVEGAFNVGVAAAAIGARVLHVSSDYVFDGQPPFPYRADARTNPLSVYGRTKAEGERALLGATRAALVVRASWFHSAQGANFVRTVLARCASGGTVDVVADQIGSPTWATGLADVLWRLASRPDLTGTAHWCDAGVASWYDVAVAAQEHALVLGRLARAADIRPVRTEDLGQKAVRPRCSALDPLDLCRALRLAPVHWRVRLTRTVAELKEFS
jgi:dTDP-4-dehydrorhamnose reductase